MHNTKTNSGESDEQKNKQQVNNLSSVAKEDENTSSTFKGLLTTSVFPWDIFSKHVPKRINRVALKMGNLAQAMMFLLWIPHNVYIQFFITINIPTFYSSEYLEAKENCSTYYLFNLTTFKHYVFDLKETTGFNESTVDARCRHLPIVVFGNVAIWLMNGLMGVGWAWTVDRRYGFLKITHETVVTNLRQRHIMIQLPIILTLIPINIIVSIILVVFGIRFVPFMATLIYIIKVIIRLTTGSTSPKNAIDRIRGTLFRDSDLSFMYLFITLLDALTGLITVVLLLFTGNMSHPVILEPFRKAKYFRIAYLIYRLIQIYKAKTHFERFRAVITRTVPFLTALWSVIDVILDVLQTRKYKVLSDCQSLEKLVCNSLIICISPLFFTFSIASFVFPVILCFMALLIGHKESAFHINVDTYCSNRLLVTFCYILKMLVLPLLYLPISVIMYYAIVPIIMIKNGLDTIRKGEDAERSSDWDPFKLITKYSGYKGILDLLGFGFVKARHIPLLSGIEQLGEASIQTILAAIFIFRNQNECWFEDFDKLLGVPFPTSILSLIFSTVSVIIAIKRLVGIAYDKTKKIHHGFLFEDF